MGEVILKLFVFAQQPQIFLGPAEMKLDAALNHSLPGDVAPVTHDAGDYLHACLHGSVNPSLHHYDAAVGCSRTGRGGAFPRVLTICVIVLTYSLSTINVLSWLHGAVMKLGRHPGGDAALGWACHRACGGKKGAGQLMLIVRRES